MSSRRSTWPAGYGRQVLAETDSTNAEGARIAASLAGPTWILALRQTAGRGRRGRPWADPGGNFTATLVMRPFDFDTLAVQAYTLASDERLAEASTASLAIVVVGLLPLIFLSRQIAAGRRD